MMAEDEEINDRIMSDIDTEPQYNQVQTIRVYCGECHHKYKTEAKNGVLIITKCPKCGVTLKRHFCFNYNGKIGINTTPNKKLHITKEGMMAEDKDDTFTKNHKLLKKLYVELYRSAKLDVVGNKKKTQESNKKKRYSYIGEIE